MSTKPKTDLFWLFTQPMAIIETGGILGTAISVIPVREETPNVWYHPSPKKYYQHNNTQPVMTSLNTAVYN